VIIIPAIDLIDGKCVRLTQGREDTVTQYDADPVAVAQRFHTAGARWIHVVDLEGAFGRHSKNREVIPRLVQNATPAIEVGGGIRSLEAIRWWLEDVGVDRIILGTVAITQPDLVEHAVQQFGARRIVVGIDARNNKVATHGWVRESDRSTLDLALEMKSRGVERIIYTDVSRDGELSGPNIQDTVTLARESGLAVIASGGFSRESHFADLKDRVEGAIVGKALYEGRLDLSSLVKSFQSTS
jgi:phosphoribosylformimino-5-aminoimidazole carboxamide ribotide isomerase